ncbi:hypothetical protein [Pseudomonas sp. DWR1-3-2b2]|uniref:hypothetical protein n=1 Tax=unclassified Pseudomonas TaxID=196821 RepID=UPI003CF227F0
MKVYALIGSNEQVFDLTENGTVPAGYALMISARPDDESAADYSAQADGTWLITQTTLDAKQASIEMAWRETQMPKAQETVTAIEYGEDGVPGTAQQWQKYWLALLKWTDTNPDFPDSTKRPTAPT